MLRRHRWWLTLGVVAACAPTRRSSVPADPAAPTPRVRAPERPDETRPAVELTPQDVADLWIPLRDGRAVRLGDLSRCVVVLRLERGAPGSAWSRVHEERIALVRELGPDLVELVWVATGSPRDRTAWDRTLSPFYLGWDPQAALALRLGVTRFPTEVVVGPEGQRLATVEGEGARSWSELEHAVRDGVHGCAPPDRGP